MSSSSPGRSLGVLQRLFRDFRYCFRRFNGEALADLGSKLPSELLDSPAPSAPLFEAGRGLESILRYSHRVPFSRNFSVVEVFAENFSVS